MMSTMLQIEDYTGLPDKTHRQLIAAVRHRSSLSHTSTMASGLDMIEKNFDKLEKFFSKRAKVGPFRANRFGASKSGTPTPPSDDDPAAHIFPHPSFIRPTSTRMLARDEAIQASHPARRAQSLPENSTLTSTPNLPPRISTRSPTVGTSQSPQEVPRRTSSLFHTRANASIDGLLEFSFAEKSTRSPVSSSRSASPTSPLSWPVRKRNLDNPQELLKFFPSHRPDTPPPSDHEECGSSPSPLRVMGSLPESPPRTAPSPEPEPSPRLSPLLGDGRSARRSDRGLSQEITRPKHLSLGNPETSHIDVAQLRRVFSDSRLSASMPLPIRDPVLKEPSFDDFLSLSDDDIADDTADDTADDIAGGSPATSSPSKPPSCGLPPDPPVVRTLAPAHTLASAATPAAAPTQASKRYPLLTLSSPLVSRPVTAAAFEAARIAARYKFDLVYVVNLWPKNLVGTPYKASELTRTARLTPVGGSFDGQASLACINPRSGMTGRLLAGYGLPSVMSPFRISAPVHQKVLKTDGWLEYRSENAAPDEFSRGYSCSFYTGVGLQGGTNLGRGSPTSPDQSPKKKRPQRNNRGIVFAAYRLPRLDGTTLPSEPTELDALYQDAEALVEMLIELHSTQRARLVARYDADETGPMPTRPQPPSVTG